MLIFEKAAHFAAFFWFAQVCVLPNFTIPDFPSPKYVSPQKPTSRTFAFISWQFSLLRTYDFTV
jgi:hypothetical protein